MNDFHDYHELIRLILKDGKARPDRTGTGTLSVFAPPVQLRYTLRGGAFPAYEGRALPMEKYCAEIIWFLLRGENTNTRWLKERGISYWDSWAKEDGDLGRIYGAQWRGWQTSWLTTNLVKFAGHEIDQIGNLLYTLDGEPYSRRHVVTAWNTGELRRMALPPCHKDFICYVEEDIKGRRYLSLNVALRSSDVIVGLPANIANYAFLTHVLARAVGYEPDELIVTLQGDAHIYANHIDAANELLQRNKTDSKANIVWQTDKGIMPRDSKDCIQIPTNQDGRFADDLFGYDWRPNGGSENAFYIDSYHPAPAMSKKQIPIAV